MSDIQGGVGVGALAIGMEADGSLVVTDGFRQAVVRVDAVTHSGASSRWKQHGPGQHLAWLPYRHRRAGAMATSW